MFRICLLQRLRQRAQGQGCQGGGITDWSGAAQLEGLTEDLHGKVSTPTLDVSSAENA
jgi:hypothetical protein